MPFIQSRIKNFLTESVRLNEFSHTVLHRQNVFDAAKANPVNQPARPISAAPPRPAQASPRGPQPPAKDYGRIISEAARMADRQREEGEKRRIAVQNQRAEEAKRAEQRRNEE